MSDASPTAAIPTAPDLDREYRKVTLEALQPLATGLAALFALFVGFNLLELPPRAKVPVVVHDLVVVAVSLALLWHARSDRLALHRVPLVAVGLAWLVASNVLLAQILTARPFYTVYIGIIVIGMGAFILIPRTLALGIAPILLLWLASAAGLCRPGELAHHGFTLLSAGMVGITIHAARRRSHRRIAQLRLRDALRKAELEGALQDAELGRQEMDRKVDDRTRELREMHGELLRELEERQQLERRRQELEAHLQHAQKVESLGRLAGGVAHDFNNLLTVISGAFQISIAHPEIPEALRPTLRDGDQASRRAAQVTRQLLAFGRRQVLAQRCVRPEAILEGIEEMLRKVAGDAVRLELQTDADLGCVFVDPGLVEQVLVNLVINARDAMPGGGP